MTKPNELPWSERVPMLSINPDAATISDIARMAVELMDANKRILEVIDLLCIKNDNA